jgi:hypothetical protein
VCPVSPLHPIEIDQPDVCLVDERRGLQRVSLSLAAHVVVGETMELVVHDRQERITRR